MQKIALGEIYLLPELLNSSALEINQRLLSKCKHRHELISILELVTPLKVLAYKKKYYAFELPNLLAIAQRFMSTEQITVVAIPIKNKTQLFELLVNYSSISAISQQQPSCIAKWQYDFCKSKDIKQWFSMRQWSEILGKHRTSVYVKKNKSITLNNIEKVDLDSALKKIKVPKTGKVGEA
jgi:hypothetical protein